MGNTFGQIIGALRARDGLTLEQMARKIAGHKGYCSSMISGKTNPPSVKVVRRIARLFKVDERDLIELAYVSKAPPIVRARLFERIRDNPLACAKVVTTGTATVTVGEPWPPGRIQGAVPIGLEPTDISGGARRAVRR